jgi:hypothetical protein
VYILENLVSVEGGATLTIEPCVLIKAAVGKTGLIISKNAKIDARGTPDCPIVFTSVLDELMPGDIVSPNLTGQDVGLWGGIFVLGNAPISSVQSSTIISLLPQNPLYAFGGDDASDNSGELSYVSIRHTGFETAPAETPSGLTLGGVGNGTTIDNVELFANADDGFLMLGGTVEINNLVTSGFNDDGLDIDMGYSGTIDNVIAIGGSGKNSALELDGGEGAENPSYRIRNASFKGAIDGGYYIDFQNNVHCSIEDVYFFDFFEEAQVKLNMDQDAQNWLARSIDISRMEFNTSHLNAGNTTIETIFFDAGDNGNDAFTIRTPDASIVTSPTVGADKSSFDDWTVADAIGALNDF